MTHARPSLLCLLLLTGCGPGATAEPAGESSPAPAADSAGGDATGGAKPTVASHMQTNFKLVNNARNAFIDGELDGVRDWAKGLREEDQYTGLPEDWKPWIERLRQAANDVVVSGGRDDMAVAVARVGLACGNCHWQAGRGPTLKVEEIGTPAPNEAPTLAQRMQRHRVAADQLWYGMIEPSEALWQEGTKTFTRAEIIAPIKDGEPVPEWMAEPVEGLRGKATEARTADSHEARAERYGEILAQCANCHYQVAR